MTNPTPDLLLQSLNRLDAVRVTNLERIQVAPMSEATKANARGVVERSYEIVAGLCPKIVAMFGTSSTNELKH